MLQADADVLLIDEVLAVGDAAFQQKCADAFYQMKAEGKTIVLVTHDMAAVEQYCHRAMLVADGKIQFLGTPAEAGHKYLKLNFEAKIDEAGLGDSESDGVKLLSCGLETADGAETMTVDSREDIRLKVELELQQPADSVHVGFTFISADEVGLFEFGRLLSREAGEELEPGKRVTLTATIENRLAAGRYFVACGVHSPDGIALYAPKATSFVVYGGKDGGGVMSVDQQVEVQVDEGDG